MEGAGEALLGRCVLCVLYLTSTNRSLARGSWLSNGGSRGCASRRLKQLSNPLKGATRSIRKGCLIHLTQLVTRLDQTNFRLSLMTELVSLQFCLASSSLTPPSPPLRSHLCLGVLAGTVPSRQDRRRMAVLQQSPRSNISLPRHTTPAQSSKLHIQTRRSRF